MDKKLEQAIVEQLGYESIDDEEVKQILSDVCRGGGNAGWSGFTYSAELLEFYKENRQKIVDHLKNLAYELGNCEQRGGFLEMIKNFNCLKGLDFTIEDVGEVVFGKDYENEFAVCIVDALCWAVLEDLAFQYDS